MILQVETFRYKRLWLFLYQASILDFLGPHVPWIIVSDLHLTSASSTCCYLATALQVEHSGDDGKMTCCLQEPPEVWTSEFPHENEQTGNKCLSMLKRETTCVVCSVLLKLRLLIPRSTCGGTLEVLWSKCCSGFSSSTKVPAQGTFRRLRNFGAGLLWWVLQWLLEMIWS